MAIIDIVRRMSEKRSETKEKFKQMQEDDRLNTMLEERKKSSNQRELEAFHKKQEESQIKVALDKVRKQQQSEVFKSKHSILASGTNILRDNKKLLKGGKSILSQKSIFLNQVQSKRGGNMFFN